MNRMRDAELRNPNQALSVEKRSRSPSGFDICIVGHITRDIIRVGRTTRATPGGTAYYTSMALRRLGLKVAVVTKVAKGDEVPLLRDLRREKIEVFCKEGVTSSVFENTYGGEYPDDRTQRIGSVGTPFSPEDVAGIMATSFHVGPLTNQDIPVLLLAQLPATARFVSLDVQGMLRPAHVGPVIEQDWPEKRAGLAFVDILKADEKEALILSGEKTVDRSASALASLGPREVVITMGSRGSVIYAKRNLHRIPCYSPRKIEDPTGCGDTYVAGYLYQRLKGAAPEMAGRFAAAMATLKLEVSGPFGGNEADICALLP
jgi:sugar/nucleoside kinase (ribokinase family)